MGNLLDIVTPLHKKTKRDYLARMNDDKVACMKIAKQFGKDYWDGNLPVFNLCHVIYWTTLLHLYIHFYRR